jgi:putative transposase
MAQQKSYKQRLYPSPEALVYLRKYIGGTRWIYNEILAQVQKEYQAHLVNPSLPKPDLAGYALALRIKHIRNDPKRPWLQEIPHAACKTKIQDLGKAFQNFFGHSRKKKTGYPQFKKRSHGGSFRLDDDDFSIRNNMLIIRKCPIPIKVLWSRDLPSAPSQVTITMAPTGDFYASFICEYEPIKTNGQGIIGIDLGITDLAVMSNGITIPNPRHYLATQRRLGMLQRRLSRKQKGSNNRVKARLKVARCHEHIANQRRDHLHKLSTALVRENQAICIEDLAVGNMARNRHLSKHIMTAGWGMFRRMLEYKCIASQHCRLIIADRYYPSTQECHVCGCKPSVRMGLNTRQWTCETCSTRHGRDDNASQNLRQLAERTLAMSYILDPQAMIIRTRDYKA